MTLDIVKIEAAKKGDKDSFAQVYDSVAPDLYKVALYTLGNRHDAEDVVSETFLEAYRGIAQLRDVSKFKPWIMKILSIRCKRKVAEYIKDKNQTDIESYTSILSDESNLGDEVSEHVTLIQALARLNEQERMIISLAVVQGYTTREVAAILGSPQGTISSKLHRALAKMRKMLEATPL